VLALAALVSLLAACGDGGAPVDDRGALPVRVGPDFAATVDSALFTVDCTFSHRAPDDPIVHPGEPGASHVHDFFGATGTDAYSTAASLRGGPTTCEDTQDTASYWAPAIYDGTRPVDATYLRAYYRAPVGTDAKHIHVLPPGIQLLAGDSHAMAGHWTPTNIAGWGCGLRPRRLHRRPPGNCTPNSPVTLQLVFPDCWDGKHVSSADHVSHVARSRNGRCPRSHPVQVLQVQVSILYPVWNARWGPSPRAEHLTLASGSWETTHGDFFNAWDEARLRHQTDLCIRVLANCTIG
jgi:hypothetical protein